MKQHTFLDNPGKARTLLVVLLVLSAAAAVGGLLLGGLASTLLLVAAALVSAVLAVFAMHLARHGGGKQATRPVSRALHAFVLHSIALLGFLLVGAAGTFSFGFAHAIADGFAAAFLLLLVGCFWQKGVPVWLAVVAGLAAAALSLLQLDFALHILLGVLALVLLVVALVKMKGRVAFALCTALLAGFALVLFVLALVYASVPGWSFWLHIGWLHVGLLVLGMLVAVAASTLVPKAAAQRQTPAEDTPKAAAEPVAAPVAPKATAPQAEEDNSTFNRDKWIIKAYSHLSPAKLMDAPVDALYGVSAGDAELLGTAFGIKTIGDLAQNKFFGWAEEITTLADGPDADKVLPRAAAAPAVAAKATAPKAEEDNSTFNRDKWIIKAYSHLSPAELMDAPVDALYGVSAGDAELLGTAFGIKTIGDLAQNKFFGWAEEITTLADGPDADKVLPHAAAAPAAAAKATAPKAEEDNSTFNRDKWIIKAYSHLSPAELMDAPVDALYGVSAGDAELLGTAFGIKTIGDLAQNKFFGWAEEITEQAES